MGGFEHIVLYYLAGINLAAFFLYGIDKRKASKGKWRVSEKALLAVAAIGGSAGALAGMYFFHHKTKKWKFKIGVPAILVVQAAFMAYILQ